MITTCRMLITVLLAISNMLQEDNTEGVKTLIHYDSV